MIIDFHSHILPGVDDGSSSVDESIAMLRMEEQQGIGEIIATPHFYPQYTSPEQFLQRRNEAMELLRKQMPHGACPKIRLGAEVYYYHQMSHSEVLQQLAIEGTNAILIEMPMGQWTDRMYRELTGIYDNLGLTPIIAHVDRYLGRFRDYGIPQRLAEVPVLVQANADFFLRHTSKAMRMLSSHQIHLLGSDCHNLTDRKPNLGQAIAMIRKKGGSDLMESILSTERMLFTEAEE